MVRAALVTSIAALSLVASPAHAQSRDDGATTIRTDPLRDARRAVEDSVRSGTVVDLDRSGRGANAIAPLLDEAPGLHPRSTGDGLAPTFVSMRGAPSAQVSVAIDGVLLNDAFAPSVDLSMLPPAAFSRADIYRGAAPISLGMQGLGGTIDLRTRTLAPGSGASLAWVTAGGGSFGQRRAAAFVAGGRTLRGLALVSYRGTNGDFLFFDDNATPLDPRDDVADRTRRNAAGDSADTLLRACFDVFCIQALGAARWTGLAGPGSLQYQRTSLSQGRWNVRAFAPIRRGSLVIEPYASAQWRRDSYADPLREVGIGDATSGGLAVDGGVITRWRERIVDIEAIARVRHDQFDTSDGGASTGAANAARTSVLAGVELRARPVEGLEALGGFGFDALTDRSALRGVARSMALASPRFAVLASPWRFLSVRVGASILERAPSLIELYGLGEYLRSNSALVPESSATLDASVIVRGARGLVSGRLELGGFGRRAENLIVLTRTSALALKAFNLRGAEVFGFEAQGRVSVGSWFSLTASYAYTSAIATGFGEVDRKRVPNIPEHDASARAEGRWRWFRVSTELSAMAGLFFDSANLYAAPPRALWSASVGVDVPWVRGLSIDARATNLLDVREGFVTRPSGSVERAVVSDFAGFPLPSRGVYVSLSWTSDAPSAQREASLSPSARSR